MRRDVAYAIRSLAHSRAFAIAAILTLSIVGIVEDVRQSRVERPAYAMALVKRRGLALAAIGIAVGLIGAFAGARYLQSMLFGVEPRDPATLIAVAAMFAIVTTAAAYLPAAAPQGSIRRWR